MCIGKYSNDGHYGKGGHGALIKERKKGRGVSECPRRFQGVPGGLREVSVGLRGFSGGLMNVSLQGSSMWSQERFKGTQGVPEKSQGVSRAFQEAIECFKGAPMDFGGVLWGFQWVP